MALQGWPISLQRAATISYTLVDEVGASATVTPEPHNSAISDEFSDVCSDVYYETGTP
jgi:hypothetical protein